MNASHNTVNNTDVSKTSGKAKNNSPKRSNVDLVVVEEHHEGGFCLFLIVAELELLVICDFMLNKLLCLT